jgi:hypothetical protein
MVQKNGIITEKEAGSSAEQLPAIETPTEQSAELLPAQNETNAKEKRPPKPDEVITIPAKKVTKQ